MPRGHDLDDMCQCGHPYRNHTFTPEHMCRHCGCTEYHNVSERLPSATGLDDFIERLHEPGVAFIVLGLMVALLVTLAAIW